MTLRQSKQRGTVSDYLRSKEFVTIKGWDDRTNCPVTTKGQPTAFRPLVVQNIYRINRTL